MQYEMPLSETPFHDMAYSLNLNVKQFMKIIEKLKENGILRRIGFSFNYRSLGEISALIGFNVKNTESIEKISKILLENEKVTHNYVRDHPVYNLWFTYRATSVEQLVSKVEELARICNVEDYIILKSARTCKLLVKYELCRGISWSKPTLLPEKVPKIENFDFDKNFIKILRDIPLVERPFKLIADKLGLDEYTLIEMLKELMDKHVIIDYGAVLNSRKIGFNHNVMLTLPLNINACEWIALNVPEASHVVYREPIYGEWPYKTYLVLHGVNRDIVEAHINHIVGELNVDDYMKLYSLKCLKGG